MSMLYRFAEAKGYESFQLCTFLENRSTIATRKRNPFCSGMVVISVAQIWSAALTYLRSTRQGNRSDGSPGTVVRGFWSIANDFHAAHEVSHPIAANRDAFPGQVLDQPAATAAGILQVESINPGHDPQRRRPHRCWPVVMRRSG